MNFTGSSQHLLTGNTLNRRILVIDDDPGILQNYRAIFDEKGAIAEELSDLLGDAHTDFANEGFQFDLTTATQGADGVALVQQAIEEGRRYAAIFLDVMMPPGIDGLETAKQIREIDTDVHIVISSAHSDYNPADFRGHVFGHLYFMRKPINPAEVEHMAYNATMSWNRNRQLQLELNNNIAYRIWLNRLFDVLPVPVVVIDISTHQVVMSGGPIHAAHDAVNCYQQLYRRDRPCTDTEGGCPLQRVQQNGEPSVIEHTHCDQEGKTRIYEVHCIPIHNELGEINQMLEFTVDVTDSRQRLVEKETLVRQQNQLFNSFRSTAHTMKNSISYLKGMAERIGSIPERHGPLGELLTDDRIEMIQDQVSMIHTMVQLALGNAHPNANHSSVLSLQQKIEESLSLFAISTLGKGKAIDLRMPSTPTCCIQMSPIDCQTILQNLLNNAADAVDQFLNEKLTSGLDEDLEALMALQDETMIAFYVTNESSQVNMEVRNRGHLIPDDLLEKIFEQGFSTKNERGNGLGLYDVRQIVTLAGGSITASNDSNREEVVFTVHLPLVDCDFETLQR